MGGLIAIVVGIIGLVVWWPEFGQAMRGVIPFALIIVGLLSIASKYNKRQNGDS